MWPTDNFIIFSMQDLQWGISFFSVAFYLLQKCSKTNTIFIFLVLFWGKPVALYSLVCVGVAVDLPITFLKQGHQPHFVHIVPTIKVQVICTSLIIMFIHTIVN